MALLKYSFSNKFSYNNLNNYYNLKFADDESVNNITAPAINTTTPAVPAPAINTTTPAVPAPAINTTTPKANVASPELVAKRRAHDEKIKKQKELEQQANPYNHNWLKQLTRAGSDKVVSGANIAGNLGKNIVNTAKNVFSTGWKTIAMGATGLLEGAGNLVGLTDNYDWTKKLWKSTNKDIDQGWKNIFNPLTDHGHSILSDAWSLGTNFIPGGAYVNGAMNVAGTAYGTISEDGSKPVNNEPQYFARDTNPNTFSNRFGQPTRGNSMLNTSHDNW